MLYSAYIERIFIFLYGSTVMKRIVASILCFVIASLLLCACSKNNSGDVGFIIEFKAESSNESWQHTLADEGVVTVTPSIINDKDSSVSYVFMLESVGEGKTQITFTCNDIQKGEVKETVVYDIKVDSEFAITAEIAAQQADSSASGVTEVKTAADAEKVTGEKLVKENPAYDGELFFETNKTADGDFSVRVFVLCNKDGKTVMSYLSTYIVSRDGAIKESAEKGIEDRIINSK